MLVRPAGYDICAATQRGLNRARAAEGFDDATSGIGWDAKEPGADIAGADWSRRNQGHNRRLRHWCVSDFEAYDEIAMNKVVPSSGYGGPSSAGIDFAVATRFSNDQYSAERHIYRMSLGSVQGIKPGNHIEVRREQRSTSPGGQEIREERVIAKGIVTNHVSAGPSWWTGCSPAFRDRTVTRFWRNAERSRWITVLLAKGRGGSRTAPGPGRLTAACTTAPPGSRTARFERIWF